MSRFSRPRLESRRAATFGRALSRPVGRIDSKYALDAGAVSRLSFEPWTSRPRIRTSSTCPCSSRSTARRTWRATTSYRVEPTLFGRIVAGAPWGPDRQRRANTNRPSCFPAVRTDRSQHMARTQAAPRLPIPRLIAGAKLGPHDRRHPILPAPNSPHRPEARIVSDLKGRTLPRMSDRRGPDGSYRAP
jgi:hypothetical protein